MLFVFSAEQRAREMGVLLASGFSPGLVRRVFLSEGAVLALAGSAAGLLPGWAFARFLLWGLSSWGSGAVAHAAVAFHATPASAASALVASAFVSLGAMALAIRRLSARPIRQLVSEDFTASVEREASGGRPGVVAKVVAGGGLLGAAATAGGALLSGTSQLAPAFFGAGALLLAACLAGLRMRLAAGPADGFSVAGLGRRNASRRPGRSLSAAGMLACGSFMVIGVSAMKEDLDRAPGDRRSGAGGFALVGETSVPVVHDLATAKGRVAHRLTDPAALEGVSFVQVKAREGDDASCLNLNQSLTPPLTGVDPERFASLGAFAPPALWELLSRPQPDGAVPALVGDAATAPWKLRKRVHPERGDVLEYLDERGKAVRIRLVGELPHRLTLFQGRLLLHARDFGRLYPGEAGTRFFLVDAPPARAEEVRRHLVERLETSGMDLVPTSRRLRDYYAVESAYLAMFAVLGALGLLLGTAGMGVLVLRSVMERRPEFAALQALGWMRGDAVRMVVAEHGRIVSAGLLAGALAALLAVAPAVLRPGVHVPFGLLGLFLLASSALARLWVAAAARRALRGPLVAALRSE
jgi:hypothetical protein